MGYCEMNEELIRERKLRLSASAQHVAKSSREGIPKMGSKYPSKTKFDENHP